MGGGELCLSGSEASSPLQVAFLSSCTDCAVLIYTVQDMLNLNVLARQLEVRTASFLQEYRTQLKCLHEPCFSGRGFVTFYSRKEAALTSRQW